ncbi:MAG: glycosyltransferase family 87 protein [Anaerolineae bacterium]
MPSFLASVESRIRAAAIIVLILTVLLLVWMATDIPSPLPYANVDFYTYYAGGVLFNRQQNIYSSDLTAALLTPLNLPYIPHSDYIYPPYLAMAMSLLSGAAPRVLAFLWGAANLACLALALFWMADLLVSADARPRKFWEFLLLALIFLPTNYALFVGQVNMIVLALMIGAFRWDARQKPIWAGIALGIAILLKVSPAILIAYFIFYRRWKLLAAAFVMVGIVVVGTLPWTLNYDRLFVTEVLPFLSRPQAHPVNQSLNGFFSRILTSNVFSVNWIDDPSLSRLFTLGSSALLTGAALIGVLLRSRERNLHTPESIPVTADEVGRSLRPYVMLIAVSVVISPLAWENLYVLMVAPLLLLLFQWRQSSQMARWLTVIAITLMVVQRIWAVHGENPQFVPALAQLTLLMSLGLYGALCSIAALNDRIK